MTSDRWATPERIRQLLAEDRGLEQLAEPKKVPSKSQGGPSGNKTAMGAS